MQFNKLFILLFASAIMRNNLLNYWALLCLATSLMVFILFFNLTFGETVNGLACIQENSQPILFLEFFFALVVFIVSIGVMYKLMFGGYNLELREHISKKK